MRKKILFIVSNMKSGGVQKSFVNLINTFDRNKYAVDVYLLSPEGLYLELLPDDIRVYSSDRNSMIVDYFPYALKRLIKAKKYLLAFQRTIQFLVSRLDRGWGGYFMSRLMEGIDQNYDIAIDYGGQQQLYFMMDKVKASKKISFFHSDYSCWDFYYKMDKIYYPKVDYIVTISAQCKQSLETYFPEIKSKIIEMENISSTAMIYKMADEKIEDEHFIQGVPSFLTLGRICVEKGLLLAIETARILKDRLVDFRWYFIGEGDKIELFKNKVKEYGLMENIIFLGTTINPYKYIKQCDIFIHPSQFEGKSIALDEAKILCKPIVVTNFSTVKDQFTDRVNATICEMTPESLCYSIMELLQKEDLQQRYIERLKLGLKDNSDQINILYRLFE